MKARIDLTRSLRTLRRSPSFALGVIFTLGLGIGVTAAAFSVVRGVLLRPLPHDEGDRLVYVRQSAPGADIDNILFSVPEIDEYRQGVPSFTGVAEFSAMPMSALDLDRPRQVHVGIVTGNYFQVMGLGTILGRPLLESDDPEGSESVAVLTAATWQTVFGGDPDVLGRTFRMNGRTVTVVGVSEPHPPYPERTDMYVNMATSPHHLSASMNHDRQHRMTEVFARLAPGAGVATARAEVEAVGARGRAAYPEAYEERYAYGLSLTTLQDQLSRRARTILTVLVTTALLVFLVALANVANLTLTRAARLSDELALRASLGATSRDLRMRLLSENLVLGVAGAVLGTLLALGMVGSLSGYLARFSVRAGEIRLDAQVLAATLFLGMACSVILSWIPRLPSEKGLETIVRSGRTGIGRRLRRVQGAMVAAQVAVSLVLVFGAGLLARTLLNLQAVDTGIPLEQVLALDAPVVENGRTPVEVAQDYQAMLDAIEAIPSVRSAALTSVVPMRTDESMMAWAVDFDVEGREVEPGAPPHRADFRIVSADYFETMGMRVLSGRTLSDGDDAAAGYVAVVNQAWVDAFLPDAEAVGQRLTWTTDFVRFVGLDGVWFDVVGVVSNIREHAQERPAEPTVFLSVGQAPFAQSILVRADAAAEGLAGSVATAIRGVEPDQPVENVATLATIGSERLGETRLNARLVGLLAVLSLMIAAVGIFAALAFSVSQRTREMGVRMALGADGKRVVRGVMVEGMAMVLAGVLLGIGGAYAASGLLAGLVYGVPATDPWTLAAGSVALMAVAMVATALPAVRAARVDPARVLGQE